MGITKKINWSNIFIFLFLVIFPFGQILRFSISLFGLSIPVHPVDIVVICAAIYTVFSRFKRPGVFKQLAFFLSIAVFSFIFSIFIFKTPTLIYGLFYLIRIIAYTFFFVYVWNFAKKSVENKKLLSNSLLGVSIASSVFGWIQFLMIPDINAFFVYGWDIHMLRLVGTFLDPTFLGLIIVFGLIISISKLIEEKDKRIIPIILFLLVSLAFTYSRASYLAFFGAMFVVGLTKKKLTKILLIIATITVLLFLLPTEKNNSIKLTRTFSVIARVDNYKETVRIFKEHPIFGVGFNNLCIARNKYVAIESFSSHACSGSDSSLLLVLATTGIVGLMVLIGVAINIYKKLEKSNEVKVFLISVVALSVHSLFSNSLFYPWVMGYMFILLAVGVKE